MKEENFGKSEKAPINSTHGGHVGGMMEHEKHVMDEDNVMHHEHFKHGRVHPDSKGSKGMHGDGSGHHSGH